MVTGAAVACVWFHMKSLGIPVTKKVNHITHHRTAVHEAATAPADAGFQLVPLNAGTRQTTPTKTIVTGCFTMGKG